MTLLSELGIAITEGEESETDTEEGRPEAASAATASRVGEDDIGLPGDPVGMYLREMGRKTLLTREDEVALAKRIEAGRQTMLDGLRESPLTMRAVLAWRDAIRAGSMALREAIDIEATHGSAPVAAGDESDGPGPRNGRADARPAKGASEGSDEADEDKPLLSAMEAELLPRVMETLDAVAVAYGKLRRLQAQRIEQARKNRTLTAWQTRRCRELNRDLAASMQRLHFTDACIETLVDELRDLNRRLGRCEGALLRLATDCGVAREAFLEHARAHPADRGQGAAQAEAPVPGTRAAQLPGKIGAPRSATDVGGLSNGRYGVLGRLGETKAVNVTTERQDGI